MLPGLCDFITQPERLPPVHMEMRFHAGRLQLLSFRHGSLVPCIYFRPLLGLGTELGGPV